jgi:prophage DNA circulation protein
VEGKALIGSFRGARFIVPSSDAVFGRRNVVHEYPLRDTAWVEDLGRKAGPFSIPVFVDGSLVKSGDYTEARDALIAAIEEEGPGTLVHPWYGTMTVSLAEPSPVKESTSAGGRATFRLVFVEDGGLRYPASGADTAWAVDEKADSALEVSQEDFSKIFDTDGLPGWSLTELAADLYTTLADLEEMVAGVAGEIAAEIRSPANMATAIIGSVQRLAKVATEPLRAILLYKSLFDAGDDCPAISTTTSVRQQQAGSTAAIQRLTQQTAVIEACRSSSQAEYPTRSEALAAAALLLDNLDGLMEAVDPVSGEPISDDVYQVLAGLRAAVSVDLRTRGARLPDLTAYTPPATLPALVVAHRIYGDATRADEITNRNKLRHPGFVVGGEELEVMAT